MRSRLWWLSCSVEMSPEPGTFVRSVIAAARHHRHTALVQFLDKGRPFGAKDVGAGERAVTTANDERIDPFLDKIAGCTEATLWSAECLAASCANQSAALIEDECRPLRRQAALTHLAEPASNIVPAHTNDVTAFESMARRSVL